MAKITNLLINLQSSKSVPEIILSLDLALVRLIPYKDEHERALNLESFNDLEYVSS